MSLIEAVNLSKYYGRFSAIHDISFCIDAASVTAFLGPNGAGKSTCIKILTGFLAPSSGQAKIAGLDMASNRQQASQALGYVSEFAPLYPDMHVAAYLRYIGSLRQLRGDKRRVALDRVKAQCQLQDVWKKPIRKLSKGFRQRVALAQAIIHDPQVLILDEPSAGLDPNQIDMMRSFIKDFAQQQKTVFLSTHIFQEVEALADRYLIMHQGRLSFDSQEQDSQLSIAEQFVSITHGEAV